MPVLALLASVAILAGCGNERTKRLSLAVAPSKAIVAHRYPAAGLSLELPRNIGVVPTSAPGVFRGNLGEAVVSAFAYRRREQLPRNQRELRTARRRLERAVAKRDPTFRLRDSRTTRVAGARAIELLGDQTISRRRLRTRSLHIFRGSAEYVIELAAPVRQFGRLDRSIFPVVRRTLEVTGTVRPGR